MYNPHLHSSIPESPSDAQALSRSYLTQIKLLTNDNQIKSQQVDILKSKVKELEEFNALYKKQLINVESKLKLYDQELKLKLQASEEKTAHLMDSNQILSKKNNAFMQRIRELEDKNRAYAEELNGVLRETKELRAQTLETEEDLIKYKSRSKSKEEELEHLNGTMHHYAVENQDLQSKIGYLSKENEKMVRLLEENEEQLRKVNKFQQQYRELQAQYEEDSFEFNSLKKNYDGLKKKYDDLFYDYNIVLLNKKEYDDFIEKNGKMKFETMEREINDLRIILSAKERDNTHLREAALDMENIIKESNLHFETEVKKAINFMDGETTAIPSKTYVESVAMQLLLENICRQNREQLSLTDKLKLALQDIRELKNQISAMMDEKEESRNQMEDMQKEIDSLQMRLQAAIDDGARSLNAAQITFEERLHQMDKINLETQQQCKAAIAKKEEELDAAAEFIESLKGKLTRSEDDRRKTLEFLREQEAEIKEFKEKFFQIAEETGQQKVRINRCSYLIAILLKVLFNLLSKFESLAHQKAFLTQSFHLYSKLKEKLEENHFIEPRPTSNRKNFELYAKFRKITLVVIAANRLRKLYLKQISLNNELFEIRLALDDLPESLKRFLIGLFKGNKFLVDKEMLNQLGEVLRSPETEDEYVIVGRLIRVATNFNKITYDPESNKSLVKALGKPKIDELGKNLRLKEDMTEKLDILEQRLREAEDITRDEDLRLRIELENKIGILNKLVEENHELKKALDDISTDYHELTQNIDGIFETLDDKSGVRPFNFKDHKLGEKCNLLHDQILNIVKYKDQLEKEMEGRNLKILELEKQILQKNLAMEDIVHNEPITSLSGSAKAPGKIIRSTDRKLNSASRSNLLNNQ